MASQDSETLNGLLGKLFSVLSAPDDINEGASNTSKPTFISYAQPGIAISTNDLTFGDLTSKEQIKNNAQFSLLVNSIPNSSGFWSQKGKKVWDIYDWAINNVTLPETELTQSQKDFLEKAENYLQKEVTKKDPFTGDQSTNLAPSPAVAAYQTYKTKYQTALTTYNNMAISAKAKNATDEAVQQFNLNGPIARQNVIDAYAAWTGEGNKGYVEEARGIISTLTGSGPNALYNKLRASFDMDKRIDPITTAVYYSTFYFPLDLFSESLEWTTFNYGLSDIAEFSNHESTSWGGGASASWGLWSASADVQHNDSTDNTQCDTKDLKLSVELVQIPLIRPWFNSAIFESNGWRWSPGTGFGDISDGNTPPKGLMPVIPTSLILARNLQLDIDTSSEKNKSALSKIESSASGGWGPFSIKGNYSHDSSSTSHNFTKTNTGIACSGMQIIGFICDSLPKSPNPDPKLPWPHD